jgi:predicted DsbA family dithiol-disulfide isomerase
VTRCVKRSSGGCFEQSVLEDERTAEALGLRGVPEFVANRKAALSGVQPVDSLRQVIEQVCA